MGSYLRSQPLKEARAKFAAGELSREQLTEVEDQEIAKLVQAQLDAGISSSLMGNIVVRFGTSIS